MTALEAVSAYLPPVRVPVESLVGPSGLTEMQAKLFQRFHGLKEFSLAPELSLEGLLLEAAAGLGMLRGREDRVRYVLHARMLPVVGPYPVNPLHEACRELGLGHALTFTVSHHSCASGLLAIDLAGRLLAADAADAAGGQDPAAAPLALVLAGEKAFTREARWFVGTTIFGEGSAACLVSASGTRDRLLAYACDVRGEFDTELEPDPARFEREYRPSLAEVIRQALNEANVSLDEISLILPHNVNMVTWRRMCLYLKFPLDRVVLDNVPATGHVFCADAFANYQAARQRGLLRPGDRYLVAAVGGGGAATFSAMVFEH
jgi:3-oxoacyl-[acyl-carrier-protein] synthase III